jgi:hypothetical protein
VPRDKGNEHLAEQSIQVVGNMKLQPGQDLDLPFSFDIPSPSPTTGSTPNSSVTWLLKGVLARPRRADTRVEEEIFVYSCRQA